MPRIDSHVHFWRIAQYDDSWMKGEFAPLRRDFGPTDLKPLLDACGIDGAIFVQAQDVAADNDWVLGLADEHSWLRGVVGWLDLTADDLDDQVRRARQDRRLCGLRHLTHNEADDDWIVRPDVDRGLAVLERHRLPFDLLFFVRHCHHGATVADRHPELPLVLDHLGKPHIKAGTVDDWLPTFRAMAERPNVVCKLSGMITEADWAAWTVDDLRRYVDHALELFGPDRLLFGSDWPPCTLAGGYERAYAALDELLAGLSPSERAAIYGDNARRVYGLEA